MVKTSKIVYPLLTICILAGAAYLSLAFILPPAPQPATALATDFSAERALQDLTIISREPRPMGESSARRYARDYLMSEIRALGLEPQVQKTFGLRVVHAGWVVAGAVENILVRLPGTEPAGSILLMAHYDTAPDVPGAADNGSGVVTILEILRALKAHHPLRQDVILLFTDGEEPGTLGAHAFVAQHPWFEEVRLVINLDTITYAPPALYITSAGNGAWIQALARSAPRPAYVSLPYHLFPTGDSDLIPFQQAGIAGSSFGAMGAFPELHTALDLLKVVNPANIQQTGDHLLAMINELGNQPTLDSMVPDQTFFPMLGRLVHYPQVYAVPLTGIAFLVFLGAIIFGLRAQKMSWSGLGLGFLAFLLSLILSVGIFNLLWFGIQALHPEYGYSALRPRLSDDYLYAIGFIALALAVFTGSISVVRKKITPFDLAAGALVFWLLGAIVATIIVPMTSYLGTWILLFGSLALLLSLSVRKRRGAWMLSGTGFLISGVLGTFLFVPVIFISYLAGSPQLIFMAGLAAFWMGSMIPILDWISVLNRWVLPLTSALVSVGFLLAGNFLVGKRSPPGLVHPIGYWLDADQEEACWIAFTEDLDARQVGVFNNPQQRSYREIFPEASPYTILTSPAPRLEAEGPHLQVIDDAWSGDHRVVRVQITSSMFDRLYMIIPNDIPVVAFTIPHNARTELPPNDKVFVLRFDGTLVEGIEIELELDTIGELQFHVFEENTGLPTFPGLITQPLPGSMRSPGDFDQSIPTDFTVIYNDFYIQSVAR